MNSCTPSKITFWLLPVLSGIFIGSSYIPFPPWASLFCFVPLWLFWQQQQSLKIVLLGGVVTAFIFTMIGFNWMTYLLHEFARLPWLFAAIGMIVYALIAHLYVPLAGALWFWGQRRQQWSKTYSFVVMALITIVCEANSLTLFDWNYGYSWYGAGVPIYQWAEFIGFSGLSAVTLLANLAVIIAWINRDNKFGRKLLTRVIIVFAVLNVGGWLLQKRLPVPDGTFSALMVQASIENSEKLAAELGKGYSDEIFNRYVALTEQALEQHKQQKIDFALWPETAFPALLGEEFKANRLPLALAEFLQERHMPLLTGAYSVDKTSRLITNSLFLLDNNGDIVEPHYSKTILLAFGEYIPGEQWFPELRNWLPPTGHFARGPGPTQLIQWHDYKIGAQICYESLFPSFTKSLADLGAQFIVNVTNDSWYGSWQEPYQHMMMSLARAVEFRRPVLRVTNTGISTVALASGEVLSLSPIHKTWVGVYQVPYLTQPPATFYQRWFWLLPGLLWTSLSGLLVVGYLRRKRLG